MAESMQKQSVNGFKIIGSTTKTTKEGEVVKLTIQASVDDITAGDKDLGKILKAFLDHQAGQTEIGLSVFIK